MRPWDTHAKAPQGRPGWRPGGRPGRETQNHSLRTGPLQSVLNRKPNPHADSRLLRKHHWGLGATRLQNEEGARGQREWESQATGTPHRLRPDLTTAGPPGPSGPATMVTASGKGVPKGYTQLVRDPVPSPWSISTSLGGKGTRGLLKDQGDRQCAGARRRHGPFYRPMMVNDLPKIHRKSQDLSPKTTLGFTSTLLRCHFYMTTCVHHWGMTNALTRAASTTRAPPSIQGSGPGPDT